MNDLEMLAQLAYQRDNPPSPYSAISSVLLRQRMQSKATLPYLIAKRKITGPTWSYKCNT